jgi:hypothetical protein
MGLLLLPLASQAQESLLGYQLGVVQGATAGQSNDPFQFDVDMDMDMMPANPDAALQNRFTGIQLSTQVTANLTFDIPGRMFEQSLLTGVAMDQQVPYDVPEDARDELRQAQTSLIANANYLIRHVRPTYGLALNLGYAFVQNGRLAGASGGTQGGVFAETTPGASAFSGLLAVTDDTQTGNIEAQIEITKRRWDLSIRPGYVYTDNGVFNLLDNGAPGAANNGAINIGAVGCGGVPRLATAGAAAPGCFVVASAHDLSLLVANRIRLTRRHNLNTDLTLQWFVPETPEDDLAQPIPETLISDATVQYLYNARGRQSFGLGFNTIYGMRGPENPFILGGAENAASTANSDFNEQLRADSLIYGLSFVYNDLFRAAELNINLEVGFAQATLFQPPIGALPAPECPLLGGCATEQLVFYSADDFSPIRASVEPQVRLTLARDFEPFALELVALREVGLGALGASALVTTGGGLNLRHLLRFEDGEAMVTNIGVNFAEITPVGQELFLGFDDVNQLSAQLQNRVLGINGAIAIPLFQVGGVLFDANLNYNFAYVDQDPSGELRRLQTADQGLQNQIGRVGNIGPPIPLAPTETHVALLALRGVWGRGTLQAARGGGGGGGGAQRDQYARDPKTGGALGSSRLIGQGGRLLDGTAGAAPGVAPNSTSDRERFQSSQRKKKLDKKTTGRGQIVNQNKTAQEEKKAAEEEEEEKQKSAKDKRTRSFGDWPIQPETEPK